MRDFQPVKVELFSCSQELWLLFLEGKTAFINLQLSLNFNNFWFFLVYKFHILFIYLKPSFLFPSCGNSLFNASFLHSNALISQTILNLKPNTTD